MDWTLAGSVIFTGLTVVFTVLIILMAAIAIMGKIVTLTASKKPAAQAPVAAPAAPAASSAISDEEVAVITAAVGAYLGNNNFTIHDIKRK
jgi:sodium pump decarboxylase gamma subunit